MKQNFLFGALAATMLLAACNNDKLTPVDSTEQSVVTFKLGVNSAVHTRAISDGKSVNQLEYAVFDENGARISTISKVKDEFTFPGNVVLTLAKGQTYQVAFWAQDSVCKAYTVSDDMEVTVDYEDLNNNESRDAFFKTVKFTVTGNADINVELKRPFAQINVGVTEDDVIAAAASGIEIAKSKVVIANAATKINLLDGEVSCDTVVTYDFAELPAESLTLDADGDGTAENYTYLSMSYILVSAQKTILDDIDFTFKPENGNDIVFGEGLNNVPVQRNWRTNIVGKILTSDIDFNISIDPIYDGETNIKDDAVKVLGVKSNNGKFYETVAEAIADNVTEIQIAEGTWKLPTISNKTIKIVGTSQDAKIDLSDKIYFNDSNVEFENITIVKENEDYVGFHHSDTIKYTNCVFENVYWTYGVEIFDNCTFNQSSSASYNVWTYSNNVEFNNCTFNCAGKSMLIYAEANGPANVVINNCKFNATATVVGKAAIEIDSSLRPETVTINNCVQTGFANGSNSGNPLYNLKFGTLGVNAFLTVDGVNITEF